MAKRNLKLQPPYKNFVRRQPLESPYRHSDDYIQYPDGDNFLLKLSKLVYESPAASSCISVIADFIEGDGFSVEEIGDMLVNNQGQTLSDIHHLLSESLALYEGFALNIKYTPAAKVAQIYFVPFENCRLGLPDSTGLISTIKYNPYFGTSLYRVQNTEEYDTFNPDPAVIAKQIAEKKSKYKGQILFWGSTRALSRFYPKPQYYAAKYWMEVDARIGEYHKNNLASGFLQSVVMKLIGDPNAPAMNPGDTVYDSDNSKQEAIKTLAEVLDETLGEKFSGTERAGAILTMWANSKEEWPVLEPFPSSVNAQLLDALQSITTKNITIATKVPAILANIHEGVSLGGDGNTIQAATKLMQTRSAKWQALLESHYKRIFRNWVKPVTDDIEIVDHNPFPQADAIDPMIWADLNPETKKKYIQENTNIEWVDPVAAPAQVNPTNVLYNSYPEKARANAAKAIKWNEDNQNQCGTKMGWELATSIKDGKPLSYKTIKRLKNYLVKNEIHMNKPFNESCSTVLFYAWGGKEMLAWALGKVKEVEE